MQNMSIGQEQREAQENKLESDTESQTPSTEKRTPLALKNGVAAPENLDQQYRLAKMYIASRMVPERFKTPEQLMTALHLVSEHFKESPLTALRQVAVINGVPSFYGDLPLAIVQRSGKMEYKKEFLIDKEGKRINQENLIGDVFGAVCITKRKEEPEDYTTVFTIDDAKRAGLWDKNVWKNYPKRMLQMRARSQNLKDNFADCLNGIGISEYDANTIDGELLEISENKLDKLNSMESGDV